MSLARTIAAVIALVITDLPGMGPAVPGVARPAVQPSRPPDRAAWARTLADPNRASAIEALAGKDNGWAEALVLDARLEGALQKDRAIVFAGASRCGSFGRSSAHPGPDRRRRLRRHDRNHLRCRASRPPVPDWRPLRRVARRPVVAAVVGENRGRYPESVRALKIPELARTQPGKPAPDEDCERRGRGPPGGRGR